MTAQPTAPLSEAPADAETVAHLMAPAVGVFRRDMSVAETVEELRELTRAALITYCYVTDEAGKLEGVVVMRDMLLAEPEAKLEDLMLRDPYWLPETRSLDEALKAALARHYPVYPVCDEAGHLKGLVRGESLFADRAVEISAQAGKMVGVEKEERLATPLMRSLRLRHPWLQINLLTAFIAAAVVGIFENTLSQLVILAVFLPVMAGQTGNTGCQALAVTMAMVVSCTVSGLAGALIPLSLKRLGADPATASSIFLTTASDVASMGIFLSLSTLMLL